MVDLIELERLVREAGRFQMSRFRQMPAGSGQEKLAREFVSEVDIETEAMLIEGLYKILPDAGVFGEEGGKQGNQDLVWIIDPLDGTTNYLSGLDQFSISIALVRQGSPEVGVVFRPASEEIFIADINIPAFNHNTQSRLTTVNRLELKDALLGTGFPYRSPDQADAFFGAAQDVLYKSRGIRRFGSAALDLSYVASGFLQGFWETDLQPYDVAAALVFLNVRDIQVTNLQGKPFDMFRDRMLVTGVPGVHEQLLDVLNQYYR